MKLKYYMRGLGIGIILTTLILTIANPKERLTDQEIVTRAKELGMKTDVEEDKLEKVLESNSPTPEPSVTPLPTPEPTKKPKPTATITPTATVAPTPTTKPVSSANTEKGTTNEQSSDQKITFTIERGMSSNKVANLLAQKGLINDANDFNNYIVKVGKEDDIRIGTYSLSKNATYEEIVKKLTQ